jgi:ABC-2 type transport system permease protein
MSSAPAVAGLRSALTIATLTARRAARSGAVWGLLFGVLIFNEAASYHGYYPTSASREAIARTFGDNAAFAALMGPARQLDTAAGWVSWRVFALLVWVGAIWGLLTATRLLRREEDAGRWELLLAGRTTRIRATAQAIAGLAVGWLVLWAMSAALTVAAGERSTVGFSTSGSLLYATAATASAAMFLAIGALTSQLAATRRQANGLAALVFATAYLIRLIADSVAGAGWLRWVSPLGWIEELRPLTGAQPLALAPIALLVIGASGLAILLAGRRDAGAAMLARRAPVRARTRLLDSSGLLVVRLERWVALAWIGGLALGGAIFGITARSAAQGNVAVEDIERTVGRLGAHPASATAAWIGYEFLYLAALLTFAAAGQIAAMRSEEADGHLDHLLARPLDRRAWLAGRLGFGAAFVIAAALATGLAAWAGIASGSGGLGLGPMLQAGLNLVPPALLVLGLGTLLLGVAPRLAMPLLYALVLWSFLIEIIGTSITSSQWLLDTALFTHVGPVPAAGLDWPAMGILTGLGLVAALAGLATFTRRDLAAA